MSKRDSQGISITKTLWQISDFHMVHNFMLSTYFDIISKYLRYHSF